MRSSRRSASVDLPWSICAMIEKLRMSAGSVIWRNRSSTKIRPPHRRPRPTPSIALFVSAPRDRERSAGSGPGRRDNSTCGRHRSSLAARAGRITERRCSPARGGPNSGAAAGACDTGERRVELVDVGLDPGADVERARYVASRPRPCWPAPRRRRRHSHASARRRHKWCTGRPSRMRPQKIATTPASPCGS